MLGLPTVKATIDAIGQSGQIDARLWDISPGDTQRLITRGVYSLKTNQSGKITFQLHGNGYRFAAGPHRGARAAGPRRPLLPGRELPGARSTSRT